MSETNTPGGIYGAILQIVVDKGTATPEQVAEMNKINQEWKDAGLEKGEWGTRVNGKLVRVGSAEHQQAEMDYLNQFTPIQRNKK